MKTSINVRPWVAHQWPELAPFATAFALAIPNFLPDQRKNTRTHSFQVLALSTLFLSATALAAPAEAPAGYLVTYTAPQCGTATLPIVEAVKLSTSTQLPQHKCVEIPGTLNMVPFQSFAGGIASPCPSGKKATITTYSTKDCTGNGVSVGDLPATGAIGRCINQLLGQSGKFTCV
ncbi:MAG: hypothetical protein Q9221_007999 [Calogaya cf. arnoldii]